MTKKKYTASFNLDERSTAQLEELTEMLEERSASFIVRKAISHYYDAMKSGIVGFDALPRPEGAEIVGVQYQIHRDPA